jgi:metal-sulfur cluster biosynthetic enzyme
MGRREMVVYRALGAVLDPELDEPITDLGFVRSVDVTTDGDVEVHLRLPTSFCAPNFAYLMASDAKDVVVALDWTRDVTVELDDHHDSGIINAGLAADAGYRGTFAHEAEDSLDELRETFRRKAHTAAMERCLTALLRAGHPPESLASARLADLPDDSATRALVGRRATLDLPVDGEALVLVDHEGHRPADPDLALRRARSTRISIDGNAHFCRGLLATRYPNELALAGKDSRS